MRRTPGTGLSGRRNALIWDSDQSAEELVEEMGRHGSGFAAIFAG